MSRVGFRATKMLGILCRLHAPTSLKHIGPKNEICGKKVVSISGFTACICFNYCYSERWKPQSVSFNLLSLSPHLSQKHSQKTVVKQFLQFVVFAYLPSSLIQSCCFWSSKWIVSSSWKWRHPRVSASSCIFCLLEIKCISRTSAPLHLGTDSKENIVWCAKTSKNNFSLITSPSQGKIKS